MNDKPVPLPITSVHWNEAMAYIEEKYGLETDGDNYPVSVLYNYLDFLDYIPKHGNGLVRIPFDRLLPDNLMEFQLNHLVSFHKMTEEDYRAALTKIITITCDEFLVNSESKLFWEFG